MKKISVEEQLEGREVDARFCWSCKTFTVFNASLVKGIEKYEIIRNEFDIDEVGLEMIENYCDATDLAIIEGRQSKGEAKMKVKELCLNYLDTGNKKIIAGISVFAVILASML